MYYRKLLEMARSGVIGCSIGLEFQNILSNVWLGEFLGGLLAYLGQFAFNGQIMWTYSHLSIASADADYLTVREGIGQDLSRFP